MLTSAWRWLGLEVRRGDSRSHRFYNQQASANYPVPLPGAIDPPREESPLDWFRDGRSYPAIERSDKASEQFPGNRRQTGPSICITHGDNPLYW